ncbi:MAG TPA: hypothetical protein VN112_18910, partial [Ensifer sp.]|nr:hypothetical protein [Ensifer sp.]
MLIQAEVEPFDDRRIVGLLKFDVPNDLAMAESEGELFFAQRVIELTFMYSKESYRVSTTTVPFLARECLSAIDDHRKFDLHVSGVERLLSELERRCNKNFLVHALTRMPIDEYFVYDEGNVSDLENRIRVFSKEVNPVEYIKAACAAILSCKPSEKAKIDFLASELVCALTNSGLSQDYIYEEARRIFFEEAKPEKCRRIEAFLELISFFRSEIPTFSALVPIKPYIVEINENILKIFKAEIIKTKPDDFIMLPDFVAEANTKNFLLVRGIRSPDVYSAAKYVKRNIIRIHDLLGLFYHKGSNELGPCMLVAKTGEPETTVLVRQN